MKVLRIFAYFFLSLSFFVVQATAEDFIFRVLVTKGENSVIHQQGNVETIKFGHKLMNGDKVLVKESGYLGLLHYSGKTIEIIAKSEITIQELELRLSPNNIEVAKETFEYVNSKIDEYENSGDREQIKNAIHRTRNIESIQLFAPFESDILKSNIYLEWQPPANLETDRFIVQVKNIYDEVVYQEELEGNDIIIDFDALSLNEKIGLFTVNVVAVEEESIASREIGIKILKQEKIDETVFSIDKLQMELGENNDINRLIKVFFLEKKGLLLDALTLINELIRDNKGVEDFERIKKEILERNGIVFLD